MLPFSFDALDARARIQSGERCEIRKCGRANVRPQAQHLVKLEASLFPGHPLPPAGCDTDGLQHHPVSSPLHVTSDSGEDASQVKLAYHQLALSQGFASGWRFLHLVCHSTTSFLGVVSVHWKA